MHLRWHLDEAPLKGASMRGAFQGMRELGISWEGVVPQTAGDQVWFLHCENVPDDLPEWVTVVKDEHAAPWLEGEA